MNPDKKYMAMTSNNDNNNNNNDTNDLNLVPFKSSIPSNMMPIGWIPIFSNNMSNGNNPYFLPSNLFNPNISPLNNNFKNNTENYPSNEDIDNLYSYNTTNSSKGNVNSNTNPENMNSTNINNSENISDVLRNYIADLDEDVDLCRHCLDKRIDKIYIKIEQKDPEIISILVQNYKIPRPIAKTIIRKIIKLSLHYCKKAGD